MSFIGLGFLTGLSLILALGAQNIFVIEQGLKKNYIFMVCLICSISDLILIFLGIYLFDFFEGYLSETVEFILNLLLLVFLVHFIFGKIKSKYQNITFDEKQIILSFKSVIVKTLGFTYLNPHVYSDTVFFLGNLSKNFDLKSKFFFAFGASISSIIFFYSLGYMSSMFARFVSNKKTWGYINIFIISFMSIVITYIVLNTLLKLVNI